MRHTLLLIISHVDVSVCVSLLDQGALSNISLCTVRALKSTVSSAALDLINDFVNGFEKLRNALDSGVMVQVLDLFCSAGKIMSNVFCVETA
jgi:hypothetical protein